MCSRAFIWVVLACCFGVQFPAAAQCAPVLVKDLNPATLSVNSASELGSLCAVGNKLFFVADNGADGRELWVSDGSSGGTKMLREVFPGESASAPDNLTALGSALCFSADGGLWKSDGTTAGTFMVAFNGGFSPNDFIVLDGVLFFSADDYVHGRELWRSDGTEAGTAMVADLTPGSYQGVPWATNPRDFADMGGLVYFLNDGGLWVSDGTEAGTAQVKYFGSTVGVPRNLTPVGNVLFLSLNSEATGRSIWKSDGTESGTVLVKSFGGAGTGADFPANLTAVDGQLCFTARDTAAGMELWKSDGTTAGTVLLKDTRPGASDGSPEEFRVVGDTLYFSAFDGTNGRELWKSNGTPEGTALVKDINPGTTGSSPAFLTEAAGVLYFSATDAVHGAELWRSDGTGAGTFMTSDFRPGTVNTSPRNLAAFGGMVWFGAYMGTQECYHLCRSDGTEAGTVSVKGTFSIRTDGLSVSTPMKPGVLGHKMFFMGTDGQNGFEPWCSDGTAAGTFMLRDIAPGADSGLFGGEAMVPMGGAVFFSGYDPATGVDLWKSDGTPDGTTLVKNISGTGNPQELTVANDTLFFRAWDPAGLELWKSDGTAAGTTLVKDIMAGGSDSTPDDFAAMNGVLYFSATSDGAQRELWKSDGTAAGTVQVADIWGTTSGNPRDLTTAGTRLYFSAYDTDHARELWKSDGTAGGTVLVKDIYSGPAGGYPTDFLAVGGTVYFAATDYEGGRELWKSTGSAAGTVRVADIGPATFGGNPASLVYAGGWIYFSANDGEHGQELWKSDGTEAGTALVKDIQPGIEGSSPRFLTAVSNRVVFAAGNSGAGDELWISDGTEAGTFLLGDITPGVGGSHPQAMTLLGNDVLYAANDGSVRGVELWRASLLNPPFGTILINGGASITGKPEVELALSWSEGGGGRVTRVRFSDDGATWTPWEELAALRGYLLAGPDGYNTVRIQYRDLAGNVSLRAADYILLDTTPPTGSILINGGASATTSPEVALALSWSDAGSGVARMRLSDDGATWTPWGAPSQTRPHTVSGGSGCRTVRVQYRDRAGNTSARLSDYIRLDLP